MSGLHKTMNRRDREIKVKYRAAISKALEALPGDEVLRKLLEDADRLLYEQQPQTNSQGRR